MLDRQTHLAVSGGPGGREAISGVRDVDGRSGERGSTNVERRPGPRPGSALPAWGAHHVAPGDGPGAIGELGAGPLMSVGGAWA